MTEKNDIVMIKKSLKFKQILVLLTFWLLCQDSYTCNVVSYGNVLQISNDYVLPIDTLTKDGRKEIDEIKRKELKKHQEETHENEKELSKQLKKNTLKINEGQNYNLAFQEKERKSFTKENKPVVFGVRVGGNLSTLGILSDAEGECSMATSFHVGMNTDVKLIDLLHLNISLLYSQKGYKYKNFWDSERQETTKAHFIMLPVQLSFRIGAFQINAGPYLDYGLGGKIKYGRNDYETLTFNYFAPLNYGIVAGAGVNLGKHFYLGANYELGFSDYANRNITASLGFNF